MHLKTMGECSGSFLLRYRGLDLMICLWVWGNTWLCRFREVLDGHRLSWFRALTCDSVSVALWSLYACLIHACVWQRSAEQGILQNCFSSLWTCMPYLFVEWWLILPNKLHSLRLSQVQYLFIYSNCPQSRSRTKVSNTTTESTTTPTTQS